MKNNIIRLYPDYVLKKIAMGKFNYKLNDFNYLVFSEKYLDGKIMALKEFLKVSREFSDIDNNCAMVLQLPIDKRKEVL